MNKKFITILILLIGFLIVGGGIMLFFYLRETQPQQGDTTNTSGRTSKNTSGGSTTLTNSTTGGTTNSTTGGGSDGPQTDEEQEINALSKSFIERFGTFSNQNDFENINNLKPYMTNNMIRYADQLIKDIEKQDTDKSSYYGITTKALSVSIVKNESGKAQVKITTQRKESSEEKAEMKVYYQDAEMVLKVEEGTWKVDSLKWL